MASVGALPGDLARGRERAGQALGFIAPLEGVRGLALAWIVALHYVTLRAAGGDPWAEALASLPILDRLVRHGQLGVDLFFLLSAFLLSLPWISRAREGRPPPSTAAFYTRRARRIVPAYYVQLAVLFAVAMPLLFGPRYWARDLYVYAWNAIAHAAFVHTSTPLTSASLGVNGALWTLAVEAQFYLVLPWLARAFVRRPTLTFLLLAGGAIAWRHGAAHGLEALVAGELALGAHWGWSEESVRGLLAVQMPAYLGHFALGMALASAWLAWRERGAQRIFVALAAAAGAALLALVVYGPVPPAATRLAGTLALAALLWATAASRASIVHALLGTGPVAWLGRVSYSMYLYHLPLLLVLQAKAPALEGAAFLPAYAAALGTIAACSWRFVERPFISGASAPPR